MALFKVTPQPDLVSPLLQDGAMPEVVRQHSEVWAFQLAPSPVVVVCQWHGGITGQYRVKLFGLDDVDDLSFFVSDP